MPDRGPIAAPTEEHQALTRIAHALHSGKSDAVKIVIGDKPALEVPASLVRVLECGVNTLARNDAVTMGRVGRLLTVDQAANVLMMPLAYVVSELDKGELPSITVDGMRRVPLDRLLEYQVLIARQRREALVQMMRSSEEMGLYDLEYEGKLDRFPEPDDKADS